MTGVLHIVLARKPVEGTIAENCLLWGCGALWIDGCRIGTRTEIHASKPRAERTGFIKGFVTGTPTGEVDHGRWPANLILGGEEVVGLFPESKSGGVTHQPKRSGYSGFRTGRDNGTHVYRESDSGSASRFFFNFAEQESDE